MNVILTNHAQERIKQRATRNASVADLLMFAKVAWTNRKKYRKLLTTPKLNKRLDKATEDFVMAEAGGFIFVFKKKAPVLITVYENK